MGKSYRDKQEHQWNNTDGYKKNNKKKRVIQNLLNLKKMKTGEIN